MEEEHRDPLQDSMIYKESGFKIFDVMGQIDTQVRRLYRSRRNRVIAGVCGGIGEYLNIDPTIIRLLWVALTLIWGAGLLLYIIAALIIPEEPTYPGQPPSHPSTPKSMLLVLGILAIIVGLGGLFTAFATVDWSITITPGFTLKFSWPGFIVRLLTSILVIALGIFILLKYV